MPLFRAACARGLAALFPYQRGLTANALLKDAPDGESVVAIIVILRIDIRRIEVEVVHIRAIVVRRRPVVAVRGLIVRGAIVEVASERDRQAL